MAHLEIVPPNQRSGVGKLSSQDNDGLWRVTCMNSRKTMLMYNDPNHWNYNLREEFFGRVNLYLFLFRHSIFGIRVIMDTIDLNNNKSIVDGRNKLKLALLKINYLKCETHMFKTIILRSLFDSFINNT